MDSVGPNQLERSAVVALQCKGDGLRTVTLDAIQHAHGKIYEEVSPGGYSIYDASVYNLAEVLS
jgi:hypothetical protein